MRKKLELSSDGGDSSSKKCKQGYLIYFIKKFYKCCISSAIFQSNGAVNFITVQHKKVPFPSTFMGHTLGYSTT
jgi:hypothetical protein